MAASAAQGLHACANPSAGERRGRHLASPWHGCWSGALAVLVAGGIVSAFKNASCGRRPPPVAVPTAPRLPAGTAAPASLLGMRLGHAPGCCTGSPHPPPAGTHPLHARLHTRRPGCSCANDRWCTSGYTTCRHSCRQPAGWGTPPGAGRLCGPSAARLYPGRMCAVGGGAPRRVPIRCGGASLPLPALWVPLDWEPALGDRRGAEQPRTGCRPPAVPPASAAGTCSGPLPGRSRLRR